MSDAPSGRAEPPLPIRLVGRGMTELVARVPGMWRMVRGPMRRFFEGAAADWDERVNPDGDDHLAPLIDAIQKLQPAPTRILDVGTGTGAAALWLARRFDEAEVLGVDVSAEMIERARAKATDSVRFSVADTAEAATEGPFDLIVHLNCPVLFGDVAAALANGGAVLVLASRGRRTPFYTSHGALRRGFRKVGLEVIGEGKAGEGTWLSAARRPSS